MTRESHLPEGSGMVEIFERTLCCRRNAGHRTRKQSKACVERQFSCSARLRASSEGGDAWANNAWRDRPMCLSGVMPQRIKFALHLSQLSPIRTHCGCDRVSG